MGPFSLVYFRRVTAKNALTGEFRATDFTCVITCVKVHSLMIDQMLVFGVDIRTENTSVNCIIVYLLMLNQVSVLAEANCASRPRTRVRIITACFIWRVELSHVFLITEQRVGNVIAILTLTRVITPIVNSSTMFK